MNLEKKETNTEILKIKVVPNSPKTEFSGEMEDGTLKLKVNGIPEKGKVNKEIINFLAKYFSVKTKDIKIISGKTSRNKLIKIEK
ncbi:hypothetical protein BKN14_05380 [Candidatus Gracilibacteria bacterium HOT-871]|nr:hypothetical protein BKN14_05380 [Candidatus Gracilibacteria bacterium HOT-871]MBB1564891.1 DUF167 domain-containing protein [Candidatus Gracilibacteria bacterium]RKW21883.1 MAG: DUF167 domain-containing protein [Candidatus Gracilibacteria bacterium]